MARESTARAAERQVHASAAPKSVEKGSQRRATATIAPDSNESLMDLDFLRGLIEAIDQSSLDWMEINRAGMRIRLSKSPPPAPRAGATAYPCSVSGRRRVRLTAMRRDGSDKRGSMRHRCAPWRPPAMATTQH